MTDQISIAERYSKVTATSNLCVKLDARCDADILLAAGFAAARDKRGAIALDVYRLGARGDLQGLPNVLEEVENLLNGHLHRKGNRPMPKAARRALVMSVLEWWAHPACSYCEGRGFELIDGTPNLSAKECSGCHGTGLTPIARVVPGPMKRYAEWIACELERMASSIHAEMSKLLSNKLDLNV